MKVEISYDGTDFYGYQRQKNKSRTIQQTIEDLYLDMFHEKIILEASGRTDAGVHAKAQVAHFDYERDISPKRLLYAMNYQLPKDLVLLSAERVTEDFHARKCAIAKAYSYQLYMGKIAPAIGHRYYGHVRKELDVALMKKAIKLFEGHHNFKGFCGRGTSVQSYDRSIYYAGLEQEGPWLTFHFLGSGFLRKMVRNMVGSLVDIGTANKAISMITTALVTGDRKESGQTASPEGLFLEKVYYQKDDLLQSLSLLQTK